MNTANQQRLILASGSVRRQRLLQQIGFDPLCCAVDVNEAIEQGETPHEMVSRLARLKASSYQQIARIGLSDGDEHCVIVAADTTIDLDGQSLGKPSTRQDSFAMLQALSDREHQVHSGVCVINTLVGSSYNETVSTTLRFTTITPAMAERYWHTGEPLGKAGGYAIQGYGAQFVAHLSGSYSNVVGLPLFETAELLRQAGSSAH